MTGIAYFAAHYFDPPVDLSRQLAESSKAARTYGLGV